MVHLNHEEAFSSRELYNFIVNSKYVYKHGLKQAYRILLLTHRSRCYSPKKARAIFMLIADLAIDVYHRQQPDHVRTFNARVKEDVAETLRCHFEYESDGGAWDNLLRECDDGKAEPQATRIMHEGGEDADHTPDTL